MRPVTDLRAVKAQPAASCVARWSLISLQSQRVCTNHQEKAAGLSARPAPLLLTEDGHTLTDREEYTLP